MTGARKHSHYFKPTPFAEVDIYRVLLLFGVTDPCLQHAAKKVLVAGGRGAGKDIGRDIQEAIDTLVRWREMRAEEAEAKRADEETPWCMICGARAFVNRAGELPLCGAHAQKMHDWIRDQAAPCGCGHIGAVHYEGGLCQGQNCECEGIHEADEENPLKSSAVPDR